MPENKNLTDKTLLQKVFWRTVEMYRPGKADSELPVGAHLNAWDWGPGIALYSLQKAYPLLSESEQQVYFRFWKNWLEANLERAAPSAAINGAILVNILWQTMHDPAMPFSAEERRFYLEYCRERIDFYLQQAHRTPSGAFAHTVTSGSPDSYRQIWADNLFMLVLLLAQFAASEGDEKLFEQMVEQVELHYTHLSDPVSRLLYHGWQFEPEGLEKDLAGNSGTHLNGALWGRGNAWAVMGVAKLLELCREAGFERLEARLWQASQAHFQALLGCQLADGQWRTLLDKDWSYAETSATAGMCYAFLKLAGSGLAGVNYHQAGQRALDALKSKITGSGEVSGVSGSTPLLASLEAYNAVPQTEICTWGQGIGLLALTMG
ncbi:MAG TPA: glycoside hydrolase family 88 protein [Chloroflexia bacterium]|nr:glycoside hydrolase family 88 protein [Chloroflexia bacterium]